MRKLVVIILMCAGFFHQSFAQSAYRLKLVDDLGEFILPPKAKIACEGLFSSKKQLHYRENKSKYRYQYVGFRNLNKSNYYEALNAVRKAEYFTSKEKETILLKESWCVIRGKGNLTEDSSAVIYTSSDKNCLVIEIDLDKILNKSVIENYQKMAIGIIKSLQGNEKPAGRWPLSISQDIVEKVFELIPVPQEASLSRYLTQIDSTKSFVLLNPNIKLKVDAVEKVKDGSNWYFNLLGTSIITINRGNEGKIIQNPFHKFQVKGMPSNQVNAKIVLQSSTEDIQLSESLRDCPFIFLWQNNFKHNNKTSSAGGCVNSETDLINCNSQLWHFDDLSSFYPTNGTKDLDYNSVKYISSYGYRNLITPVIDITINGNIIQCPLGLNLNQLRNQMAVPLSFKIYRFWDGKYVKIKANNLNNLILLPNDKIIF